MRTLLVALAVVSGDAVKHRRHHWHGVTGDSGAIRNAFVLCRKYASRNRERTRG